MPENQNNPFQGKRIALVHDWLNGMRGGEKCLEVLCEIFPDATLFSLIHEQGRLSEKIEKMNKENLLEYYSQQDYLRKYNK